MKEPPAHGPSDRNRHGNVEAVTERDVAGRFRQTLCDNRVSPTPGYMHFTAQTGKRLRRLADPEPRAIAAMHGSTFVGDGRGAIDEAATMMAEALV